MIKKADEIKKMRVAARLAAEVLEIIEPHVKPGISTGTLEEICRTHIIHHQQANPSTLGHHGYPAAICTSLNHVVCHGIPSFNKILKSGDILNIDVTVKKDGYIGDTSRMFCIGKVKPHAKRLIDICQQCLYQAIQQVKPGAYLGDIGHIIEQYATSNHYTVVREYGGHGIGQQMWEKPHISHFGKPETGLQLLPGMTFTIEPMINLGTRHVRTLADGWTVVTKDRRLSAQWEHTLLVTESGCDILTLRQDETIS